MGKVMARVRAVLALSLAYHHPRTHFAWRLCCTAANLTSRPAKPALKTPFMGVALWPFSGACEAMIGWRGGRERPDALRLSGVRPTPIAFSNPSRPATWTS